MARSTRKTTSTSRTTTSTPTTKDENTPLAASEAQGVESHDPDAENAAGAVLDPSAPVSDPDGDPTVGDSTQNEDDEHEDDDETLVEEGGDEPESKQEGKTLNSAHTAFETDEFGNALEPAVPDRATDTVALYPFEYEDGEKEGTIVATERVYSVMRFYGTKRKGRTFAFPKGAVLDKVLLDTVDNDA